MDKEVTREERGEDGEEGEGEFPASFRLGSRRRLDPWKGLGVLNKEVG